MRSGSKCRAKEQCDRKGFQTISLVGRAVSEWVGQRAVTKQERASWDVRQGRVREECTTVPKRAPASIKTTQGWTVGMEGGLSPRGQQELL